MVLRRSIAISATAVERRVPGRLMSTTGVVFFHQRGGGGFGGGGGGFNQGGGGGYNQGGGGGGYNQGGGGGYNQGGGFNQGGGGGYNQGGGFNQGGGGGGYNQGGFQGNDGGGFGGRGGGRGRGGRGRGGRGGGGNDVYDAQQAVADSMGGGGFPMEVEPANVSAKKLVDLKKICKGGKTRKERAHARSDASRTLKFARLDEGVDERTVLTILNAAAFFKAPAGYKAVCGSFDWVRANLSTLSPRNVANAAYAIGAIRFREKEEVMTAEILPAIASNLGGMQDVELAMSLQALGRAGVGSAADAVAEQILSTLLSKADSLHVTCVSTLLSAVSLLGLSERNPALVDEVLVKAFVPQVARLGSHHSDVITGLAHGLATLQRPPPNAEQTWKTMLARLVTVAPQVSASGISRVYEMLAHANNNPSVPKPAIQGDMHALLKALDQRVDSIATFFTIEDAGEVAEALVKLKYRLPQPTAMKLGEGLQQCLIFSRRGGLSDLAHCAEWCFKAGIGSPNFFIEIANMSVGVRTPRPLREGQQPPEGWTGERDFSVLNEPLSEERRGRMARKVDDYLRVRLACEGFLGQAAQRQQSLNRLGANILEALPEASPEVQCECLKAIVAFPPGSRNANHDRQCLQIIGQTAHAAGSKYMSNFSAAAITELGAELKPKASLYPEIGQIIQMLKL